MSRRTDRAAAASAAEAASEAARVLQARSQESKAERSEAPAEQASESRTERVEMIPEGRLEKLRNANPRYDAMEEIVRKREGAEPKAEEVPAEPEKPQAPAAEAPQEQAAPTEPVAEPAAAPEAPKTVRVKVDGEEFDAPADEVEAAGGVKNYQMHKASENRLRKANEALAESKRLADLVLRQAAPAAAEKPKESDEQFIASKMDTIRFGSPEEAAKAQVEIIQRLSKPVDQNAIVAQATNQWRHDQAVQSFDKEFQDLVTNPIRLKAVVALRQERVERHRIENPNQPIDWNSFYRTIGNEVRSAFGGHHQSASAPAATPSTTSQASEKEARKASIVNLPTAAARAAMPAEEKTLSPEEERRQIIADMKKARGQA